MNISTDNIGNVVEKAYSLYGKEVNTNRAVPNISDGLKTVYKRTILGALSYPRDKFIKVQELDGFVLGKSHPHGGVQGVIGELVRMGIFDGDGNFGYETMIQSLPQSAGRYIHCRVNPNFRDMIEPLLPYVRESLGEMDNYERDYIPTPIPLLMSNFLVGMAIGCSNYTSAWTIKSLILATAKDKPELLQPTNGLKVSNDDKINFWNNNKGSITYKFSYSTATSGGLQGWYIIGNPSVVKPNLGKLKKLKEEGRLVIRDECHDEDYRVFIGIPKRIAVDRGFIEKLVKEACVVKTRYDLWCVYGTVTRPVTGKYWCNYCFNNYQRLVEIYKKDKLTKLKIDLEAFTNFKDIADLIINRQDLSYSDIQTKLKLTSLAVVERVGSMSVGSMRTTDGQKRAEKVKEEIKKFENLTYKDLINPYLKSLK